MHHFLREKQGLRRGFTLLELLVVVAIIGFLSSVSILALSASRENSRDQQRKLDQLTIVKASELYFNDFGAPPAQMCIDAVNPVGVCDPVSFAPGAEHSKTANTTSDFARTVLTAPVAHAFSIKPPGDEGGGGPVCGNGVREGSEQCDDGNNQNCDACTSACQNGSGNSCGDGVVRCGEQCDGANLNGQSCVSLSFTGGTLTCSPVCQFNTSQCTSAPSNCNNNLICEPQGGENYSTCPSDCSSGGGTPPASCGNGVCNVGETPGNCAQDCTNISMCYVGGQWNLCCAFGTNCPASGTATPSGYYGVCNGNSCQVKYLESKPSFTCSTDADCLPYPGGQPSGPSDPKALNLFVPQSAPNWLRGLEPYIAVLPRDPGKHNFGTGHDEFFDKYYVSSHPDIVGSHVFCAWVSFHRLSDNFNPYNDLNYYPTGTADASYWTPLCTK